MLDIREASEADCGGVAELNRSASSDLRKVYLNRTNPSANTDMSWSRMVAVLDGAVVGTVQYAQIEDRVHIRGLVVHPTERHKGVACALIDRLHVHARVSGLRAVSLYTIKQTGNVPVFERMGFRTVSEGVDNSSQLIGGGLPIEAYMERSASLPSVVPPTTSPEAK